MRSDLVSENNGERQKTLLVFNFKAYLNVITSFRNGSMHRVSLLNIVVFEIKVTCSDFGERNKVTEFRRRNRAQLVVFIVTIPVSYRAVLKRPTYTQSNNYNTNSYCLHVPQHCI